MFESLGERLQNAIDKIKGYGKITEDNISDVVREIRLALLEADVNYKVVKEFVNNVKEKALGEEVTKSLKPGEVFVKILKDELVELLGGEKADLNLNGNPATLMLVGLQGTGKTTMIGKLGLMLRKKYHKKPLLVACDVYRPAAIDQLKTIGKELNIELHIDTELMDELKSINENIHPDEILLVVDSMTGQDAINVIEGFNEALPLTGAILTKLDGDTRGGAALSIRHLTNVPIKFVGVSEKMDGIEEFYPERMATRILGMGDIMTMLEKAESVIDEEEALKTAKKMQKGNFDLEDFLSQLKQIKKLGPLENLLKMIPGAKKMGLNQVHIELKASRKVRIAKGSGRTVEEENRLLKQFEQMKDMMKKFQNGSLKMPF